MATTEGFHPSIETVLIFMLKFDSCSSCASITGSLFPIKADDASLILTKLCFYDRTFKHPTSTYFCCVLTEKTEPQSGSHWLRAHVWLNLCASVTRKFNLLRRGYFCCPRSEWEPQWFRLHESHFLMSSWEKCSSKHSTSPLPPLWVFLPQPSQYLHVLCC